MKTFTLLFSQLDQTNKTKDKLEFLKSYFLEAPDGDKIWALALFSHRRPKRTINTSKLRDWCQEAAGLPSWLFEECYHSVGDLAETIALLLPQPDRHSAYSLSQWIGFLSSLALMTEDQKKQAITDAWRQLTQSERFVFNKLITGGFRVGVSQNLVTQAVAEAFQMEKSEIAHRIMGYWDPANTSFQELILSKSTADNLSRPYPFCLAHPLDIDPVGLGDPNEWLVEWKWDGIRGQLINRYGEIYLWSRGEELITEKFPELESVGKSLPSGTVIDGEILPYAGGSPLPFALLQTRIGRKNLTKKIQDQAPVCLMAYDLLEWGGEDIRLQPLHVRRELLVEACKEANHPNLLVSKLVSGGTWEQISSERETSRERKSEGLMLKKKDSVYETGRKRGAWWKWKIDPLTIDGVLLYAQKGHGRRADLYSDYTLAVWKNDVLIPFAKAYSGLTDAEMAEVDRFVKQHTRERFGPVRTVTPELVFEIAFEGIQESPRHKSGIALRFPRIMRWRKDKKAKDANTLEDLKLLLAQYGK